MIVERHTAKTSKYSQRQKNKKRKIYRMKMFDEKTLEKSQVNIDNRFAQDVSQDAENSKKAQFFINIGFSPDSRKILLCKDFNQCSSLSQFGYVAFKSQQYKCFNDQYLIQSRYKINSVINKYWTHIGFLFFHRHTSSHQGILI